MSHIVNRYQAIFRSIRQQIFDGIYPIGSLLPSEHEFAKSFGVSRETIRKALVLLLENGYIQKIQGKGSIVLDRRQYSFPLSEISSFKELNSAQGMGSRTIIIRNEWSEMPSSICSAFNITSGTFAWCITRVREVQGERIILDYDYLLDRNLGKIDDSILADSLYEYLEDIVGLEISYAQKIVTCEPVTLTDSDLLDLDEDSHVVVIRSTVFLKNTTIFQYTESRHRQDRFCFVDFARRR